MESEANDTFLTSCGGSEPPYAQELLGSLDLAGRFLLAILTLMTLIADLVFMEEVIYIYRKTPSSKRSILIWINAAAPVIATTSCIGIWIPRSTMFTDFTASVVMQNEILTCDFFFVLSLMMSCIDLLLTVANEPPVSASIFFAIVIHKFLMMMIKECGGQKLFLKRFENGHFKISTGPCCCCCLCLPGVRITRRSLFWLKVGTFQFALFRPVFMFLSTVLWTNDNYSLSNLSPKGAAIWISCFVAILTIVALWPVAIMFQQVRVLLNCKKIIPKFALYQFILILIQLQTATISILAMQRIVPCVPPLSSSARGAYISHQILIMEMFLITLMSRVVYRRRYKELDPPECISEEAGVKKQAPTMNVAVNEDGS